MKPVNKFRPGDVVVDINDASQTRRVEHVEKRSGGDHYIDLLKCCTR